VRGLADQATLMARGFLARILYSLPHSKVGSRRVAAPPAPAAVEEEYQRLSLALWRLGGPIDPGEKVTPKLLTFAPDADAALQQFERWREPQMAEGEPLSHLAGWAQKLAGACARIAGGLHVAHMIPDGQVPLRVCRESVESAIRLGKEYLLPHARS